MVRSMMGYAALAVIGFVALKLVFALLGFALNLFFALLWLAAIGFGIYLLLKLISPDTARRVREMVTGRAGDTV